MSLKVSRTYIRNCLTYDLHRDMIHIIEMRLRKRELYTDQIKEKPYDYQ